MERPKQVDVKQNKINVTEKPIKTAVKESVIKKETENKEVKEKEKVETKKGIKIKKTEAIVNGKGVPVSTKHSIAICNFIRGKNIDKAIAILEEVKRFKRAVPMKGEIPHRRGRIMSGRYPIKAVGEFIKLLRSLKSNAINNELELEKYAIFCKADVANRPYRRFGRTKFKRTNVLLKLIKPIKKNKKKK